MFRISGFGFRVSVLAPLLPLLLVGLAGAVSTARATVSVSPLYGNNMVIQRDKPFPVWGTAAPNKTITVTYNGQTSTTTSDAQGNWQLTLPAMSVKGTGSNFTISESGGNTLTLANVVVGDVWVCSGQSNMAFGLSSCNRQSDINAASYPGIRHFWVPLANLGDPSKNLSSSWSVCSPSTASGFSAVAFYFGRKIYLDQNTNIPIGLIAATVGGTCIDPWLAPEGLTDLPVLAPLFSQPILPWGPFSLFNGMIYPLAPFPMKGAIWYQGENRETTSQSTDSYFLKEKALQQGWKRLLGLDDFAYYVVLLANYGTPNTTPTPDLVPGGSWADTRLQQLNVLGLPHAGVASAIDVGNPADIHPTDKLDVGERLALWALKNDYGRTNLLPSGPVLRDVTVSGTNLVCSFDYVGAGLMVGSKTPYLPTVEVVGGALTNFSIAGASGSWFAAAATINPDNTVTICSPFVTAPRKVAYACWQSPTNCNFYNRDGLPANPFYVDDVTAKYTITASAGAGGSITPAGVTTCLKRRTALYTITPDPGYYILDVKVDGASLGAVNSYTFDPLYANHTLSATFTNTQPSYTLTASAAAGGSLNPTGTVAVAQGGSQSFAISPNPGNLVTLTVDGKSMGQRTSFTFGDVRAAHTLSVAFSTTVNAQAGYGGTISPSGNTVVNYGANQTFTISPLANFSIARVTVDGTNVGPVSAYSFSNIVSPHTIIASFAGSGGTGSVPQQNQIVFSCLTDTLPTNGAVASWSTFLPSGQSLAPMGTPTVEVVDGRKFEKNLAVDGDGFRFGGSYSASVPCTGASIVVVAKPTRYGTDSGWQSLVDVFYDRLVLGIMNGSGKLCVRRNGSTDYSSGIIPEGQTTILSLIVQTNGLYKVYANGTQAMSITGTSDMTSLVPGVTGGAGGYGSYINVGRNNPDGWTTFNGDIGDVFLYKTALSDTERLSLETYLANRLTGGSGTNYTINATAGSGGSIAPSGAVSVPSGGNQSFSITPSNGWQIASVQVDGASQGPLSSWTFTNVLTNHTLSAIFTNDGSTNFTISASAGSGGSITPSGAVLVRLGTNQSFTIAPNAGYQIADVQVDGLSKGAVASWTFTNVTADHSVFASFSLLSGAIPRTSDLLFSCLTDTLPASGNTGPWATFIPTNQTLTTIGSPSVEVTNGVKWEKNIYAEGDGYRQATYSAPIPASGVTIITAVRPSYMNVSGEPRGELVDFFYSDLFLAVAHNTGEVIVDWRGYHQQNTGYRIPDGQPVVLSLVVQQTGEMSLYANGVRKWGPVATGVDYSSLQQSGLSGAAKTICVGRNDYDGWSTFNGNIGDVFVYKTALTDAERQQLEASLTVKFVNYTITATAGSGGTLTPNGAVSVSPGTDQTFTVAPLAGYTLANVTVDGTAMGALSSYTFTNVAAPHLISAAFRPLPPNISIAASAGGYLEISWPDTHTGPLLWSPTLGPGASWTAVDATPEHPPGRFRVTVLPDSGARFYALGE